MCVCVLRAISMLYYQQLQVLQCVNRSSYYMHCIRFSCQ